MLNLPTRIIFLFLTACFACEARAEVRCASLFGDHMVLQRDQRVAIWGTASPGERVTVEFAGQSEIATASADGNWLARVGPFDASAESRSLLVHGENTVTFFDVLVGEVWFCSGQSNMEKQVGRREGHPQATDNYEVEIKNANHPLLRLYQVPHHGETESNLLGLSWVPCTPDTIQRTEFSAVAYYFGRELLGELKVPIGLIHSSFGASQIEAWMPEEAFTTNPALSRLRAIKYPAWDQGMQATQLYESMVKPYVPYTLKGFLWYQGEANCIQADDGIYTEKMRALVESWRERWGEPDAPWYYVQIAPFRYSHITSYGTLLTAEELPAFWEAQTRAQAISHTGMVVTTDLAGDRSNIHPPNKRDVGVRLARLALSETYRCTTILARGPQFTAMRHLEGGSVELAFKDVGAGLKARDGAPLREFAVAGADHKFVPAHAEIRGNCVIVRSWEVPDPLAVRLAWRELAAPNLVNSAGLPAIPFRSDDWPIARERQKPEAPAERSQEPGVRK